MAWDPTDHGKASGGTSRRGGGRQAGGAGNDRYASPTQRGPVARPAPQGQSAKSFYDSLRSMPSQRAMPTTSGPGGFMGKILPSGDQIGAGVGAMMPSWMGALSQIGAIKGEEIAGRMRQNPGLVRNVGGMPMMMQDGQLDAFNSVYGNKDPQAQTMMSVMQGMRRGAYQPWRGDIPFFRDAQPTMAGVMRSRPAVTMANSLGYPR